MHGNSVGLRAALDDLAGRRVDGFVCLGDVAQGGPQPVECLELVRESGARMVMGNADAFLIDPSLSTEPATERQLEVREWTLEQLPPGSVDFMRSFEPTVELDLGGLRLLCFHGRPRSYDEPVLPEDPPEPFDGTSADVLAGGHVHVQQLRRVGDALYVNPGSIGRGYDHLQPEDDFRFDPWALVCDPRRQRGRVPPRPVRRRGARPRHADERPPHAEDDLWRWQPRHS